MDALADGDELLGLDIALLVGHAEILVRDLRNDDLGIVDGSVGVDDFLLLFLRLLRSGDGLCSLDVLAVLEELDDLNGLAGTDDDVPVGQLVLDLALHNGDLAGDDERAVVDLLIQLELVEELLDGAGGELAGGPCRQDGHAGGVGDEQVDRHIGALDLAGDEEVGQSEVDGQHAGIVGRCAVHRVDAGRDLHRLLRVGEDVLAQAVQRQGLGIADALHDDDGAVLQGEDGGQRGLEVLVARGQLGQIDDGGIAERAVAVLQRGAADEHGVGERLLDGLTGDVDDEVLVARGLELGDEVMQLGQAVGMDAEGHARLSGDGAHLLVVLRRGAVEDGLAVLADGKGLLRALGAGAVEDQGTARCGGLLDEVFPLAGGILLAADHDELDVLALADALIVDLLDVGQLLIGSGLVHAGADGNGEAVAVDKGLLVAEQDGLAAELDVIADRDGLHGRRSGLGELCLGFFGEVRAFIQSDGALCDLHAEGHAGGAAAFLTVFLGRELKDIQAFQCHCMFLLPLRPALRSSR